jgi:hypothetical protein
MRLRTAALGILAAAACRSAEQPPDEGGVKAGTWRVRDVPECSFSVEVPEFAARTDLTMPEFPDVIDVAYTTRSGLAAQCTVYPPDWVLPPPPELLRTTHERSLRHMDGIGGGVVDQRLTLDEAGVTATYTIQFANGTAQRGRMMVVGRQVHELSAAIGEARSTAEDLSRMIRSYTRR